MPTLIGCPHCRRMLTAADSQAGQVVLCPWCRQPVPIPIVALSAVPAPAAAAEPDLVAEVTSQAAEGSSAPRRRQRHTVSVWWGVGMGFGVCVVLVGSLMLVGWFNAHNRHQELPTREELRRLLYDKSESEVIKAVGRPDRTSEGLRATEYVWYYSHINRDAISGQTDPFVRITFNRGRVVEIDF